jgi:multiple sugar transport system substrate-binding protein
MKSVCLWRVTGLALVLCVSGCGRATDSADGKESITIWWAQWAPADGLQELGQEFEQETGIAVRVHQIPWGNFQDQVFLNFGRPRTDFDIVVGDSQWLGRCVTRGLYVDLTEWLPTAVDLSKVHPNALRYLCEYPTGSGRYWAAPCETDAQGFAYRRDWFEDPAEQEAFRSRYGYELGVPATWQQVRDIAEFFQRPERKQFGISAQTGRSYDELTMSFQMVMWAFGGDWSDEQHRTQGILNGAESVAALTFLRDLARLGPRGGESADFGTALENFTNDSTSMLMVYFAFFPGVAQKMGEKVGFFAPPSHNGRRVVSLGGQGMSISTRVPPRQQELAKKFIAWFSQDAIQWKWITKDAGFTANTTILASEQFRRAAPYNAAFAESLDYLRDFYNIPEYNELLAAAQRFLGEAMDGKRSPQEALDRLAEEHEKIFRRAGYLKDAG